MGAEIWLHFLINIEANVANVINKVLGQVHIIVTIMDLSNNSTVVFMVLIPQCIFLGLKYLSNTPLSFQIDKVRSIFVGKDAVF